MATQPDPDDLALIVDAVGFLKVPARVRRNAAIEIIVLAVAPERGAIERVSVLIALSQVGGSYHVSLVVDPTEVTDLPTQGEGAAHLAALPEEDATRGILEILGLPEVPGSDDLPLVVDRASLTPLIQGRDPQAGLSALLPQEKVRVAEAAAALRPPGDTP